MTRITTEALCGLVKRDRYLCKLTQEEMAAKLNKLKRPVDVRTKRKIKASRAWISRIEKGLLKEDLSLDVRQWLAEVLNGDIVLYKTLPFIDLASDDLSFEELDYFRELMGTYI